MRLNLLRRLLAAFLLLFAIGSFGQSEFGPDDQEQNGASGNEGEALPDPFNIIRGAVKGLAGAIGSISSRTGWELEELVANQQYAKAAELYERELKYFTENRDSNHETVTKLGAALNARWNPEIDRRITQLDAVVAVDPRNSVVWRDTLDALNASETTVRGYEALVVLQQPELRSPRIEILQARISTIRSRYSESAVTAFTSFVQASDDDFFQHYPSTVTKSDVVSVAFPVVKHDLDQWPKQRLDAFWKNYGDAIDGSEKTWFSNLYVKADKSRPGIGGLTASTKALDDARAIGLTPDPVASSSVFVGVVERHIVGDSTTPLKVVVNLPVRHEIASLDTITASSAFRSAQEVVLVAPVRIATNRRVPNRTKESSKYKTGEIQVPNPEYEQARAKYYQAENSYRQIQNNNSATAARSWAGVILQGVAAGLGAAARTEAYNSFAGTPTTLSQSVYENYSYSVSTIEVSVEAILEAYKFDRINKSLEKVVVPVNAQKTFEVAYGIHENDPDSYSIKSRYSSEEDVTNFEAETVEIKLSEIVDRFTGANATTLKRKGESAAIVEIKRRLYEDAKRTYLASAATSTRVTATATQSQLASVVVIRNPNGSLGSGFYVTPSLVLTNAHVVEGAQFAEVKTYGGKDTFGKIIRKDVALDLALIKVADLGQPVELETSPVEIGSVAVAIGHPKGFEFSVTQGVVSGYRKRKHLGRLVTVVQTDTPINAGNSGGPLFVGKKVVGANTIKFSGRGVEGIAFAVHSSEIRKFLDLAGVK